MKKLLITLLCLPMIGFGQFTYVPDDIFENYLENNGLGDGVYLNDSVFTSAIDTLNKLDIPNNYGVNDLTGIKDFITSTITDAVTFWLPYLTITKLEITTNEDDPNMIHHIKISLSFTVTGSNSEETITIFAGQDGILKIE